MKNAPTLISVKCPNCNADFDLQESIMESIKLDFEKRVTQNNELKLKQLEKQMRTNISLEFSSELTSYKEQLMEKVKEAKELRRISAEFERLKREKDDLEELLKAKFEKEFTQALDKERKSIKSQGDEKTNLKIQEKEMIINQLKEQLLIAQRKAEQGSMQIQGEVQELSIESILRESFIQDVIDEVKKGVRGADCLFRVIGANGREAGSILIESKRTKSFQMSWIDKLKADIRESKATFAILVTEVLPKEVNGLGQIKGIWVTNLEGFRGLVFVLREAVLLLNETKALVGVNKGKMEKLYNYLVGSEFRGQVESILQTYLEMQNDLNKEQRAIQNLWKTRQSQLESVLKSISGIYGSCRGITGNALPTLKQLDF